MSTENQTALQKHATKEERELILKKLLAGFTLQEIYTCFMVDKKKIFVLDTVERALLPELFENLPKFDLKTRQFSDEEFAKHLSLFKLVIDFGKEGFSVDEASAMVNNGIFHYGEIIQSEGIVDKERLDAYFTLLLNCKIKTPVLFTEQQQAQLN